MTVRIFECEMIYCPKGNKMENRKILTNRNLTRRVNRYEKENIMCEK